MGTGKRQQATALEMTILLDHVQLQAAQKAANYGPEHGQEKKVPRPEDVFVRSTSYIVLDSS